jgi:hypothetical protein
MEDKMRLKVKKPYYILSFSFWGLILAADQLLLPMFHFNGLPFKLSYFLAGYWFVDFLVRKDRDLYADREFKIFAIAVMTIVLCSCIGELFFAVTWNVESLEPFIRSVLIYMLMMLSFGLGLSALNFNFKWLISIILVAILLNFGFIFLKSQMPPFLISLYYGDAVMNDFASLGLTDVESVLALTRPRGLFPNPNGSAFLVNIISLFLYLGIKHRLCGFPKLGVYFLVITLPVVLTIFLASRGEFLVSMVLAALHYSLVAINKKSYVRKLNVLIILVPLGLAGYVSQKIDMSDFQVNIERTFSIINTLDNSTSQDSDVKALSGLARPLLTFVTAYERFKLSPIVGTGYAVVPGHEYFTDGTDYYHNDWFRLIVTSGLVGLIAMLWIINRFVLFLGWPVLIPFVLPGMVNSFLLNIPAVMFFFFMIGCMRSRLKRPKPLNI